MRWAAEVRERLRGLLFRAREEAEMDEELRFHLEMETEKNLRAGMSPEEARRQARIAFGGMEGHREALREGRKLPVVEDLWLDVRYGARSLRRSGGFTAVVIATLALGIGTSVATYSAARAVATNAAPFPDPDRLFSADMPGEDGFGRIPSYEDFRVWQADARPVADLAGYSLGGRTVGNGDRAIYAWSLHVTERFFPVLRARPTLGRTLLPGDELPDAAPVAVVSPRVWRELLGSDPEAVGRTILIGERPYTVVGVLAAGQALPAPVDVWTPLTPEVEDLASLHVSVIGRLEPDGTAEQARVALRTIQQGLDAGRPAEEGIGPVEILPLTGRWGDFYPAAGAVLLAAVLFLLLIGTANAASLMTTRAMQRRQEIAIRASLGSGRLRIVRQLLVESTLLALSAGALGVLVAYLTLAALRHGLPETLTRQILGWERIGLDGEALLFALAVSGATGLLFGIAPALGAVRGDLTWSLRDGALTTTADRGRSRAMRLLLSGEVALALMLLLTAGLLTRSLLELMGADPGFRPDGVLAVEWLLPAGGYQGQASVERFQEPLLERLRATPGVEAAGAASNLPTTLPGFGASREYRIEGTDPTANAPRAAWRPVTPQYLEALGVPLLRGRHLAPSDAAGAPRVAVVSEAFVRRSWPEGADPLGARLRIGEEAWTVVGVMGNVHHYGVGADPAPTVYVPQAQSPTRSGFLVARVAGDPGRVADLLRREIWSLDPDIAAGEVQTMERVIRDFLADQRIMAYLLAVYATMALGITAITLYALVAHSVARRRRELGIRLALGARPRRILASAMGQGLVWVGIGLGAGLLLAAGAGRLLAGLLYGVGPLDPLVYTLVPGAVLLLAILASYLPAREAARVDPAVALRAET